MTRTLPPAPRPPARPRAPLPPVRGVAGRIESSAIRDLLALTERPDVISLAGGKPAPDAFPVAEVRAATDLVLERDGAAALQYSTTEGHRPLRAWFAARLAERAGRAHGEGAGGSGYRPTADEVTITTGSQQGLDLVARALVAPGDVVVSADPGYIGAVQAFRLAGAELVGVPGDRDGLRVDVLADRLAAGLRPAAVYVVADLSNPTGATMPADRRAALAGLADRYGFWLVEDDPYRELRWSGTTPAPLAAVSDRVVSLGTVSKVLCPGLRIGYLAAPAPVTEAVVLLKQAVDLHTSTLAQRVVHELVTRPGFLGPHVAALPATYRRRAEALTTALRGDLDGLVAFDEPAGGMFVWARLTGPRRDASALLGEAVAAGVAYVPGPAFAVTERHADHLRLSFATPEPDEIAEGARRLATVLSASPRR